MARKPPYRILLIDDDELIHDVMARAFKLDALPFDFHCHGGPMQSTNVIRTFKPDAVLLDLNMPAIDGARLHALVKPAACSDTLFFAYSAHSEDHVKAVTKRLEMDGYFLKSMPASAIGRSILRSMRQQ